MATPQELLSVLNNQHTNLNQLSLADALQQLNQPPPPTLAEKKKAEVVDKVAVKKEDLGVGRPEPIFYDTSGSGGNAQDIVDLGQSSLYRAGGNLLDAGKGISNKLFDTEFDDSAETGFSNVQNADESSGLSQEYRQQFQKDQRAVLENVAEDDWWGAVKSAANVGFRTAVDSAGSAVELGAGALLSAVPGGQLGTGALLGRKAKKVADAIDNIGDRYGAVKEAELARKAAKGLNVAANSVVQTSLITTDLVQQQRAAYIEEYGEEPSAARLAGSAAITMATMVWQIPIAKKLFVPRVSGTGTNKAFKEQFVTDMKKLVTQSEAGMVRNVANRVAAGVGQIAAAGGAEAVQEYAQTWAEILSVKMQPEEAGGFLKAAWEEFGDKENQDKAITGAFLGGAAGGNIRGVTAIPQAVVGSAVDTVTGTGKAIGTGIANKVTQNSWNNLSEAEKAREVSRVESKKAEIEVLKTKNTAMAEELNSAATFSDVRDQENIERLENLARNRDLNDPKVFNAAKKNIISKLAAEPLTMTTKLNADRTANFLKNQGKSALAAGDAAARSVANYVGIDKDTYDKALEATVKFSKSAVVDLKNLDQSAARGLVMATMDYASDTSKEQWNKVDTLANKNTPKAIQKVANAIRPNMPKAAARLDKKSTARKKAIIENNIKKKSFTNYESLDSAIKQAPKKDVPENQQLSLWSIIEDTSRGKFEDTDSIVATQNALDVYENSQHYKLNKDGAPTEAIVAEVRAKLEKEAVARKGKISKSSEGVKSLIDKATNYTKQKSNEYSQWTEKLLNETAIEVRGLSTEIDQEADILEKSEGNTETVKSMRNKVAELESRAKAIDANLKKKADKAKAKKDNADTTLVDPKDKNVATKIDDALDKAIKGTTDASTWSKSQMKSMKGSSKKLVNDIKKYAERVRKGLDTTSLTVSEEAQEILLTIKAAGSELDNVEKNEIYKVLDGSKTIDKFVTEDFINQLSDILGTKNPEDIIAAIVFIYPKILNTVVSDTPVRKKNLEKLSDKVYSVLDVEKVTETKTPSIIDIKVTLDSIIDDNSPVFKNGVELKDNQRTAAIAQLEKMVEKEVKRANPSFVDLMKRIAKTGILIKKEDTQQNIISDYFDIRTTALNAKESEINNRILDTDREGKESNYDADNIKESKVERTIKNFLSNHFICD